MLKVFFAAMLCFAAVCCRASELPAAPSSVATTAMGVADGVADPADDELAYAALNMPVRSFAEYSAARYAETAAFPLVIAPLSEPRPRKRVVDGKFMLLMGISTGLTIADYEMTLSCLSRHVCKEGNPTLPTSRAGMYASNMAVSSALYYLSYRRKAAGKRLWWIPPLAIIGSHTVGVASNIRFVGKPAR